MRGHAKPNPSVSEMLALHLSAQKVCTGIQKAQSGLSQPGGTRTRSTFKKNQLAREMNGKVLNVRNGITVVQVNVVQAEEIAAQPPRPVYFGHHMEMRGPLAV